MAPEEDEDALILEEDETAEAEAPADESAETET